MMKESRPGASALKVAASLKGIDTSKVAVDDEDQAAITIAAGSTEEAAALEAMEALIEADSPAKAASQELKLMCLRGRKYDPVRAAALMPDAISLIDTLDLKSGSDQLTSDLASGKAVMTGARDRQERAIVWLRFRLHDPRQCEPRDFARLVATLMLNALKDAETARRGVVILQDMTGLSIRNLDPKTAKFMFGSVLPRLPVRIARVVIFNPPWIVGRVILPVAKTLMSPKLRSRLVVIHSSNAAMLNDHFPQAL